MRWPVYTRRERAAWALVDEADVPLIQDHIWRLHNAGYAHTWVDRGAHRGMGMHRLIMGLEHSDGLEVDHINGDRLDNRRSNLRVVTHAENAQNHPSRRGTSIYRGVYRNKRGRWIAQGKLNGAVTYLGTYDTELEAARASATWRRANLPFSVTSRDVLPDVHLIEEKENAA